jgi:sulfite reductase alpha subunit-like flavoprotein
VQTKLGVDRVAPATVDVAVDNEHALQLESGHTKLVEVIVAGTQIGVAPLRAIVRGELQLEQITFPVLITVTQELHPVIDAGQGMGL